MQDPYPFYARARALGDLVVWEDYGMVVATTHRAVGAILKDRRRIRCLSLSRQDIPACAHLC